MLKSPELGIPAAVFTMQNVLPRSGARAYTVSDDASADQRYKIKYGIWMLVSNATKHLTCDSALSSNRWQHLLNIDSC